MTFGDPHLVQELEERDGELARQPGHFLEIGHRKLFFPRAFQLDDDFFEPARMDVKALFPLDDFFPLGEKPEKGLQAGARDLELLPDILEGYGGELPLIAHPSPSPRGLPLPGATGEP